MADAKRKSRRYAKLGRKMEPTKATRINNAAKAMSDYSKGTVNRFNKARSKSKK